MSTVTSGHLGRPSAKEPVALTVSKREIMEEQLQDLLERIRKDGVEKAEAEAQQIVADARAEAARIVAEARREAADHLAVAERDAQVFMERSTTTLEQSGRDFLLRLRSAIERVLRESVREAVGQALTPDSMAGMLQSMAEVYAKKDFNESRVEVLVSQHDRDAFVDTVFDRYRDLASHGLEIEIDDRLQKGFKVRFLDYRLYHDFTLEAISEALAGLLKPPLDEIMQRAAGGDGGDDHAAGDDANATADVRGAEPPNGS